MAEELLQIVLDSVMFILPLWVANAAPTVLGGGAPIDRGRLWRDGKRILGDGKTIRGFWMGVLCGTLIGGLVALIIPRLTGPILPGSIPGTFIQLRLQYLSLWSESLIFSLFNILQLNFVNEPILGSIVGFVLAFGGLTGDIVGSFIKRRSGIERGHTFIFLDQLGFLVLGVIFIYPIIPLPIEWFLVLVPITFLTHVGANLFGYFTGIQDDPL